MDKVIDIAYRLKRCRDVAKRFLGNEYEEKIKPHKHIIRAVMKANNITNECEALLKIGETEMYKDNLFTQVLFQAAVVDLMESQ